MTTIKIDSADLKNYQLVKGSELLKIMDDGYVRHLINGKCQYNIDGVWQEFTAYECAEVDIETISGYKVMYDTNNENWKLSIYGIETIHIWLRSFKEAREIVDKIKESKDEVMAKRYQYNG